MPVEKVSFKMVEVLTIDYEHKQRTILCRENITCAGTGAKARETYMLMSGNCTKIRSVWQAFVTSKLTRRNRNQESAAGGEGISSGTVATKNDQNKRTKNVGKTLDDMRNKHHRCLEPNDRWFKCTTHVILAAKESQSDSRETI